MTCGVFSTVRRNPKVDRDIKRSYTTYMMNTKELKMKKILAIALFALASSQAFAWGQREQGIVTGIAATLLIQEMTRIQNGAIQGAVVQTPQGTVVQGGAVIGQPYGQPYYPGYDNRGYRGGYHGHGYGCARPTYDMYGRRTGCIH